MEKKARQVKILAVLGATGSIGRQALDIISLHPESYRVDVLTAGSNIEMLSDLARRHHPRRLVIADVSKEEALRHAVRDLNIEVSAGDKNLEECVLAPEIDIVLTATVGYSGLAPTIAAIKAGKDIALANKETLVVAGYLINSLLKESRSTIYAVDSEHCAIAQCLAGEDPASVSRLLVTASGGPFLRWDKERMDNASASDALRHPNWNMGAKITIDSASMMNKAFELIEAHHLFGVAPNKISAIVHPQSIVHSMVEFNDGAIKAQLGVPDMHLPIAYALGENTRLAGASRPLTLEMLSSLTFEKPDIERFPCLTLASVAMNRKGNTACVINAANEIAVSAFLHNEIQFGCIYPIIAETLEKIPFIEKPDYEDFVQTNAESRARASLIMQSLKQTAYSTTPN